MSLLNLASIRVSSVLILLGCGACAATEDAESSDDALTQLSEGPVCSDPTNANAPLPCPQSIGAPNRVIEPGLVDNGALFQDPFFKRTPLHHRGGEPGDPLKLTDDVSKNYFFPTLYRDSTTAVAMFFCDFDKAKALMPDPSMEPVDMGLGRSLVIISSYRYNRVFGMNPYNEVAIAIPAVAGRTFHPPILPLLLDDWRGLGFYVHSMPVTTLENKVRGVELWGLPKIVQQIDLATRDGQYVTTVKDDQGKPWLEFRVPTTTGEPMHVDNQTFIYSRLNGTVVRSPSNAIGEFNVTKFPATLAVPLRILQAHEPPDSVLILGDSPVARSLKELGIAPRPFQMRFSKGTLSTFDLPDTKLDDGKLVPLEAAAKPTGSRNP